MSTTAGELDTLASRSREPNREVRLRIVTGQVDVRHHVELPRADEFQPQVGDALHLAQVQQRLQRGLPDPWVDLLADQEPAVPVDQCDGDDAEQHPDQDRADCVRHRRFGDLMAGQPRQPR